jgi:hypothetical protein
MRAYWLFALLVRYLCDRKFKPKVSKEFFPQLVEVVPQMAPLSMATHGWLFYNAKYGPQIKNQRDLRFPHVYSQGSQRTVYELIEV